MEDKKQFLVVFSPSFLLYRGVQVIVPSAIGDLLPLTALLASSFFEVELRGKSFGDQSPVLRLVVGSYFPENIVLLILIQLYSLGPYASGTHNVNKINIHFLKNETMNT